MRRILVTSALPYANGDIHLGYLLEAIQTDIWVRFQKMRGHRCFYVCADDAHGTPVMLKAEAEGIAPERLIERMNAAHRRDLADFGIAFDNYYTTHSPENRELSETIFRRAQAGGHIAEREISQLFDPQKKMFLPDRFVRGECPRCGAADQYGDSCEACGAAYAAADLKNPYSAVSGASPVMKRSAHYFFRLSAHQEWLRDWTAAEIEDPDAPGRTVPRLQAEARKKMAEWLNGELRDWDISRDAPYFGFPIPGAQDKFFYVWLDAPVGYMASFQNLCARLEDAEAFDAFWKDERAEIYHFIGKDILYFHALFWPAMLRAGGYRTPSRIFAHGFLTVDGEKMSKSRGTFITARRYLDHGLNPEWLRYYYAAKLNERIEDLDLNLDDFRRRINSDLVGKLINIPSRIAGFLHRRFGGAIGESEDWIKPDAAKVGRMFEERRFADAVFYIMRRAEEVNRRLDECRPWELAKDESKRAELHRVLSAAAQAFRLLAIMLRPILPRLAGGAEAFLNIPPPTWDDLLRRLPVGHTIGEYRHLMRRMEESEVRKMIEAGKRGEKPAAEASAQAAPPDLPPVAVADFAKLDLRVAEVVAAEEVAGADKLLKLTLNAGDERPREVLAGIKRRYAAADLVGRRVVYFANLAPRKMRFGVSEGMVLAAEDDSGPRLLQADAAPGAKVR